MDSLRKSNMDRGRPVKDRVGFRACPKSPPADQVSGPTDEIMIRNKPWSVSCNQGEVRIGEDKDKIIKKKYGSLFFAVGLFFTIAIFVTILSWHEFHTEDNVLEKILSKNVATTEKPAGQDVKAKTAQAPPVQQNPATTVDADTEDINTGVTSPQEISDSEEGEKKTYENNKEGISFDYPDGYEIEENNGQIIATKDGAMWRMKIYDNDDKQEIKDWFDEHFDSGKNADCVLGDAGTLKFGTLATKTLKADSTEKKCDDAGFFALSDDKKKIVRMRLAKADEAEANKILISFKFVK